MKFKRITFKIDKELLRKVQFIADCESRSVNEQILLWLRAYFDDIETEHGQIHFKEQNED